MATTIKSTALDFTAIKNNLKVFLSQQDEFTDYNFEASGLSSILDVLAYNTHYNGLIANFALNESYLGTAQLRSSLVSLAEGIGYIPDSMNASQGIVTLSLNLESLSNRPTTVTLASGVKFNAVVDGITYVFQTQEEISGTTGGFISGNSDKLDVSGYAVADITCSEESEVKGIPVYDCSASVDPTQRLIQANLLKTYSLLDATPSALPIYLGSEIKVQSEQLSGLIIAGDSTTRFYLDTRDSNEMKTSPSFSDLVPVFEIQSSSTIGDSDADKMRSSIVQNQDFFTYWSNFDTPLDFIPFLLWVTFFGSLFTVLMKTYRELGEDDYEEDDEEELVVHEIELEGNSGGGLLQRGLLMQTKK